MPVCVLQDVPGAINGLLDSLPAKVSVQGLPFDAVFTYAVYTLNYVIVKVCTPCAAAVCVGHTCMLIQKHRAKDHSGHQHCCLVALAAVLQQKQQQNQQQQQHVSDELACAFRTGLAAVICSQLAGGSTAPGLHSKVVLPRAYLPLVSAGVWRGCD